ncbi:MAG TPA: hypothetical protein VD978_03535 [Azospirillum sp.]|nr:hypothetical protein [Azospirillum sp.]
MDQHDYLRHTLDCLEEAQAALYLAQRKGQIEPKDQAKLVRRLGTLTQDLNRVQQPH